MDDLILKIHAALTPDLLKGKWKGSENSHPQEGHCYVAAEALWHLTGKTLKPKRASYSEGTHWWLEDEFGNIFDPTVNQYLDFGETPPYSLGVGNGFLTKEPSKRAKVVIERVNNASSN